jgi:hypothetical protein
METRIVLFLAFVSIALITNTLLFFLLYKAVSGVTSKVTETASIFTSRSEITTWLSALQSASEQAVAATDAAKLKIAECQPVVESVQKNYRATLTKVDSRLAMAAGQITTSAKNARDVVVGPAFSFMAFAAGLTQAIENLEEQE